MDKPKVKLVGRDGNAFFILGSVRKALKDAGWETKRIKKVMDEMTKGDYNNLLQVAMKYCEVN